MARPKKKLTNPELSMEQLLQKAAKAFAEPYDDRLERNSSLPSLRFVADELGTTVLRTRKLLITVNYFSTETSRRVQQLINTGHTIEQVQEKTGLSRASINSYLPYKRLAFNLDQTTVNADRHRLFRQRRKAVEALKDHIGLPDELEYLWKAIIAFEGYPFKTAGRNGKGKIRFAFRVSQCGGNGGQHYGGREVDGYGNQLWIDGKEKSISRSTVDLGYRKAKELGVVKGPKALGLPGCGSYLYPIFLRLGVCRAE